MDFQRITTTNQWDYLTYTLNGTPIPETVGGFCDVRYPDGTVFTRCAYHPRPEDYSVGDHGKTSYGTRYRLKIHVNHHGISLWVDLTDLEVCNVCPMETP